MIETTGLTVRYDKILAVNQVTTHITSGEKVSIVGRSGCGKTSFLHAVAGLLQFSEGEILIKHEPVHGIRDDVAIILQKDGLFPWKTVSQNILLALSNASMMRDDKTKWVHEVLKDLEIGDVKDKYLHEISGGQRQRAAIARALVQKPAVLLMDEPTGSLDMITKERFQDSLHELYQHLDVTAVIVTHDIEEAVFLGQRILVMENGRIISDIENPLYGQADIRESIDFYKLCLKVRLVMKA